MPVKPVSRCRDCTLPVSHPGDPWYQSDEDSGQPRNQLQTDFMAAHIPHSVPLSPGFYFHNSNPPPHNQQSIITNLGAFLYNHSAQAGNKYQVLSAQDLILVDPFWVGPMHLSSLIPPDFPLHIDSIRAESFSRDIMMTTSYRGNLIDMLDIFRKKIISVYGGNLNKQVPTIFSIARASNYDHIPTQFGVSAPQSPKQKKRQSQMADLVRNYRVCLCWGEQQPPRNSEAWKHGQCAENQSLPSVVAQCADLGLINVTIDSLAMNKSGKLVGMCGNCQSYVSLCVLRKHPTWKVIDVTRKKEFS